ncbi:Protein CBG12981 [Caenorhabditis briggsae]|uniref:Protein CBG12981 n=2 Tax=Caenorhabditis briggsae TaxID=6238 RepID=A8XGT7_CAEBR|nr:Protein CBG12981 [Caenorhabditis briggsae]UMM17373.1 hypothetical protein L5515_013956 [Caenorhabditis briggsae]CAP31861.1 Protein CBG12981 [Caenorhabditis briggsae]
MRSQLTFTTHRLARCFGHRCSVFASTSHDSLSIFGKTPVFSLQNRQLHLTSIQSIRARYPDDKHGKHEDESQKNHKQADEQLNEQQNGPKKIDPATIRKLRMYVLAVAGLSFVTSFLMLSQMFTGDRSTADGLTSEDFTRPGIPMKTFVEKYLKHGEVKRIVFVPANARAIAILHPGAVIDGQPAAEKTVIVEYPQNSQQFWAEIRKAEAEIGIGLSEGVQIDLYQGMTTFKVIELLIGVVILAWLGTQYGRLLRKRLLENQAKNAKK